MVEIHYYYLSERTTNDEVSVRLSYCIFVKVSRISLGDEIERPNLWCVPDPSCSGDIA